MMDCTIIKSMTPYPLRQLFAGAAQSAEQATKSITFVESCKVCPGYESKTVDHV